MYYTRFFKIKFFRENICQPLLYNMPVPHRPQAYTSSLVCLIVYSILLNIVNNDTTSSHIICQITPGICYRSPCKMIESSIFHSIRPQYSEKYTLCLGVLDSNHRFSENIQLFKSIIVVQEYHRCSRVSSLFKSIIVVQEHQFIFLNN